MSDTSEIVRVSFCLPIEIVNQIDAAATQASLLRGRSTIVRQAVQQWLTAHEADEKSNLSNPSGRR